MVTYKINILHETMTATKMFMFILYLHVSLFENSDITIRDRMRKLLRLAKSTELLIQYRTVYTYMYISSCYNNMYHNGLCKMY